MTAAADAEGEPVADGEAVAPKPRAPRAPRAPKPVAEPVAGGDDQPELPDRLSEGRPSAEAAEQALVRKPRIGDTRPAPAAAAAVSVPAAAKPAGKGRGKAAVGAAAAPAVAAAADPERAGAKKDRKSVV